MWDKTILWRRIDQPGHDACRFGRLDDGWVIEGHAVFHENEAVSLAYRLDCDASWTTRAARVVGWLGKRELDLDIRRHGDSWTLNSKPVDIRSADVDLGFTPATNTNAMRRLDLAVGEEVETTALWLDTTDWTLKPLPQTYRRLSATRHAYVSPLHDFRAELETDDFGVILDYPGLWRAE